MVDRRVRRTRRLLGDALIDLILEKGFDHITIRDLTDKADVAYATFFRHYDSIEDLLMDQLNTVMEDFSAQAEATDDYFRSEGTLFFQHILEHERLYHSLLSSRSSRFVLKKLREMLSRHISVRANEHYQNIDNPAIPLDLLLHHLANSTIELASWWLENRKPHSPETMAQYYERLVIQASWLAAQPGELPSHPPR